jgi:serine/threonine-protein kinase
VIPDPHLGREILGRFRLTEMLARGGMAAIYAADDSAEGGRVAIKILGRAFSQRRDIVSRFRREARAMASLTSPHVARVQMYGQLEEGSLYIVMELVLGPDLARLVREEGPLDPPRAIELVVQACHALDEAHRREILHRDLKPENLLVARRDGRDHVKLIDFGLARVPDREKKRDSEPRLTDEGSIFGTPQFMSPEQCAGLPLGTPSDLYSLGLILYEALTRRSPYDAQTPAEYVLAHVDAPPIPLQVRCPALRFPAGLQSVMDRVLAKDPAARHPTAAALAADLRRVFLDG